MRNKIKHYVEWDEGWEETRELLDEDLEADAIDLDEWAFMQGYIGNV